MFQLTTSLTPVPGRAGSLGVPGAGGGANGGKATIDLPDFMTFASSGAPAPVPGNARQDPAGDGEAVPGGTVLPPPAVLPDGHAVIGEMASAFALPIVATASGQPAAQGVVDAPTATETQSPSMKIVQPAAPVDPATPGKARPVPAAPGVTMRRTVPAVQHMLDPDRAADPESEAKAKAKAGAGASGAHAIVAASTPREAAPMLAASAPAPLDPPTVEARAPTVGGSPDTLVPSPGREIGPSLTAAAMQSIEPRADAAVMPIVRKAVAGVTHRSDRDVEQPAIAAVPIAIAAPVTVSPFIPTPARPPSSLTAAPMPAASALAPLDPPTVEARAPTVGGSPDTLVPSPTREIGPSLTDAAMQPIEPRADAAGPIVRKAVAGPTRHTDRYVEQPAIAAVPIAIAAPVMVSPFMPAPACPPSPLTAAPAINLGAPDCGPVQPRSVTRSAAMSVAPRAEGQPVRPGAPGVAPLAVTAAIAPSPLLAEAAPFIGVASPTAVPARDTSPRIAAVGDTPAQDTPAGVSLGTIVRMLSGGAPVMPTAYAPAAVSPAPAAMLDTPAIATTLPAMPANVAAFLASVAPRSFGVTVPDSTRDAASKVTQQPVADRMVAAGPSPIFAAFVAPAAAANPIAAQVFADAIHAATGQRDRPYRVTAGDVFAVTGPAIAASSAPAVPVTDRAPLDMTQAHWPMKMIERIEYLRDAADAQDTRIKLIPDALGAIDVSMRRDGDTVRVHLAAERPETRAMIADAQPRLAELGEQRGLKIAASSGQPQGQANGQAGPQDFHQPRGNTAPQQPARPASARTDDQTTDSDDGDQRLA